MSDASDSLAKSSREYADKSLGAIHELAARIAELEAENSNLREADREADRVLSAWVGRAERAEAEMAALKAQRCEGCGHWEPDEHTYGWCETVLDEDNPIATRPDFCCNRWAEKG